MSVLSEYYKHTHTHIYSEHSFIKVSASYNTNNYDVSSVLHHKQCVD